MAADDGAGLGQASKRVTETGLAVVHEGELVFPALGSEAQAELALDDSTSEINVYFPVEIEIRSIEMDGERMRRIAEQVLDEMARSLSAKG